MNAFILGTFSESSNEHLDLFYKIRSSISEKGCKPVKADGKTDTGLCGTAKHKSTVHIIGEP